MPKENKWTFLSRDMENISSCMMVAVVKQSVRQKPEVKKKKKVEKPDGADTSR